jgi:pyruvate dehydrogenase E2 component (dihydrolipoamide acetyltransferase)
MEDKAVVRNGEIVIRPMMTLSLTADHRIIDGATAAEFLQRVKNLLENPALMLA